MKTQWAKLDFTVFKNLLLGYLTNGRLVGIGAIGFVAGLLHTGSD